MDALQSLKDELNKTAVISQEFKTLLISLAMTIWFEGKAQGKKELKNGL